MAYELFVRLEAEADLADTYTFYQECRPGLGNDFMLCAEEAVERVLKNPFQYQEVHMGVRRALIHRFPYCVFYIVIERKTVCLPSCTPRVILSSGRRVPDHSFERTSLTGRRSTQTLGAQIYDAVRLQISFWKDHPIRS